VRVLMLGWEFPPYISGGLGTACDGLTRAMARRDVGILFVLPEAAEEAARGTTKVDVKGLALRPVPSATRSPYGTSSGPYAVGAETSAGAGAASGRPKRLQILGTGAAGGYEGDLAGRVQQYADRCLAMTRGEPFDLVHAHDWVTYPAGQALAEQSGRPLVVHVHATEFDRSGEAVNGPVYDIERRGMHAATAVVTVSHYTKRLVVDRYGVEEGKVQVVHNGIDPKPCPAERPASPKGGRTVLFMGRITGQKGPGYFVSAARRVLEKRDDVRFLVAGWGDLAYRMIEDVAAAGLGRQVRFTGFLRGDDVQRAYRMSDVYVMPSVSEPFGLTALEAVQNGVPVVLSKTSGAAEVLRRGALRVDFWDVDKMADRILALVRHPELAQTLRQAATDEIRPLTWDKAAAGCLDVYRRHVTAGAAA